MESKELKTKQWIEDFVQAFEGWSTPTSEPCDKGTLYDVFVSHSSSDREFIRKVQLFLYHGKGGVHAYVDWQDPKMQHPTDAQTAFLIKERIKGAKKLIYVVTTDSLKSLWCSWELGFADSEKGVENVAILAIKPNHGRWKHNEYLQQYPWIIYDNQINLFQIIMPDGTKMSLYEWLKK